MWPNQATRFEICCKGAVIYPCVQKVSDVIFFARKLMKHGRCAVVGGGGYLLVHKWIFSRQNTASVACSQRASENVYAARVALLFSVKISSRDSDQVLFSCFQVGDQLIIARSHVRRVGCLWNHMNVVFGQESLKQLRHVSRNRVL